jgi:hypothetical protein
MLQHLEVHANRRKLWLTNPVAERIAIDSYRDIINYLGNDDPTTRRLIETIDLGSLLEECGA